jgi:ligand-binding SRPBCC domain-containing protein
MRYRHTFRVNATVQAVVDFHARSASMGAITPPPVIVQMHRAPEILRDGDQMDFTLWLGPLPIRWQASIENTSPNGFTDRQLIGPFQNWLHRHSFQPIDKGQTEIIDEISYTVKNHPFWGVVGMSMGISLPFLFAFRAWKTRRLLTSRRLETIDNSPKT